MKKLILIFLLIPCLCFGAGSVNSGHPRIWIDGTSGTIITKLKALAAANATSWTNLKSWCDSNLGKSGTNGSGYEYSDWFNDLLRYGLCYQVTGSQTYGNEGVYYLNHLLNDACTDGSCSGKSGSTAIQCDSGWVARTAGTGIAIGRDWLDGSSSLTSTIIQQVNDTENTWITWYASNGYDRTNYYDNYTAEGYLGMVYTSAIGLSGDTDYQSSWLTSAQSMWTSELSALNGAMSGGDWLQGWNYGEGSGWWMTGYVSAIETGTTGFTDPFTQTDYFSKYIPAHIHMTYPYLSRISDQGDWSGNAIGDPRYGAVMAIAALPGTSATNQGLAKWYSSNLTGVINSPDLWQLFLWDNSGVSPITPTSANMGGLAYLQASGHGYARSDTWTNTNATFVDVDSQVAITVGEHDYEAGEVKIGSRGQFFVTKASAYEGISGTGGQYFSTPRVTGTHTYNPYQEPWTSSLTMVMDNVDATYAYFKMGGLETAYGNNSYQNVDVSHYTREVLFIRPDYTVVFDNMTTTAYPANVATYAWQLNGNPTISGTVASLVVGSAKIFVEPVDSGASLSKVQANSGDSLVSQVYTLIDTPTSTSSTDFRNVTVFETAASSKSNPDTVTSISATHLIGTHITGASADTVALFNNSQTGAAITLPVSYTTTLTQASNHTVSGLPANTLVAITGGASAYSATTSSKGVLTFSDTATGSTTYTLSQSSYGSLPLSGNGTMSLSGNGSMSLH